MGAHSPLFIRNAMFHRTLGKKASNIIRGNSVGRDSAVGIATRYGLDGAGIESRWGRDFPHPSRPDVGPPWPPVQWVPGLFSGG